MANAMDAIDTTKTITSISNMHTPVDTYIDVLDTGVYMAFDYDDTLLNTARHYDFRSRDQKGTLGDR